MPGPDMDGLAGSGDRYPIGSENTLTFRVTEAKTVPNLYPESEEFQAFPHVFATGFVIGLLEWACMRAMGARPRASDAEMTVGAHVDVRHLAPAVPGQEVTAWARLVAADPPSLLFKVRAFEGDRLLAEGTHERWIVSRADFEAQAARLTGARVPPPDVPSDSPDSPS